MRYGSKGHESADGKKRVRVGDEVAPSFVGAQARQAARGPSGNANKKQYHGVKVKQKQPTLTIEQDRVTLVSKLEQIQNQ